MMKRLTGASMIVALSALSAAAQTAQPPQAPPSGVDSRTNSGQNAHGSQTQATTQATGAPNYVTRQGPDQFLGISIVQQPVYMTDGRGIGEIDDLLIDRSGRIAAVVIDVGGFLGVTGRRVAVPMESLDFQRPTTPGSERTSLKVVFPTDRAQLEKSPNFESAVGRTQRSR